MNVCQIYKKIPQVCERLASVAEEVGRVLGHRKHILEVGEIHLVAGREKIRSANQNCISF
jgi:hypothetical protein